MAAKYNAMHDPRFKNYYGLLIAIALLFFFIWLRLAYLSGSRVHADRLSSLIALSGSARKLCQVSSASESGFRSQRTHIV